MVRVFASALILSAATLGGQTADALELRTPLSGSVHSAHVGPQSWARYRHDPAITKTLQNAQHYRPAPPVAPSYEYAPQPRLPAPVPPRFSYPQQGYYPQDGQPTQQAPGYEYDFGGGATYPPLYPMEGAHWRGPRMTYRATGFSQPHGAAPYATNGHVLGTYADCPR